VPGFRWALADGNGGAVYDEIASIVELGLPVKVILEAGRLGGEALQLLVEASIDAGAAFSQDRQWFGPAATAGARSVSCGNWRVPCRHQPRGESHPWSRPFALVEAGATRAGHQAGGWP